MDEFSRRMVEYEPEEYFEMLMMLGEAEHNYTRAAALYAERHPDDRHPGRQVFISLENRLLMTNSMSPNHNRGERLLNNALHYPIELENLVLEHFNARPGLSTRVAAIRLGTSHQIVQKILKDNGRHPYHFLKVQDLVQPRDYERRLDFCNVISRRIRRDPQFLGNVLWTDECIFTPNGCFNSKNFVEWHDFNPHLTRTHKTQFRWSINIWAGVIGPYLVSTKK